MIEIYRVRAGDAMPITGHQRGLTLSESFAMIPISAVSGYYFAHPQAECFGVARIARDQLETMPGAAAFRSSRPKGTCARPSATDLPVPPFRGFGEGAAVPYGWITTQRGGRGRVSKKKWALS